MLDCARLMETIEQAEARAEKLLTRCNQDGFPFHPPYTTVGRLTREIRKAALAFSHQGLCPWPPPGAAPWALG